MTGSGAKLTRLLTGNLFRRRSIVGRRMKSKPTKLAMKNGVAGLDALKNC
jgi:hypothetical protein